MHNESLCIYNRSLYIYNWANGMLMFAAKNKKRMEQIHPI
jgi:hypothetical protein